MDAIELVTTGTMKAAARIMVDTDRFPILKEMLAAKSPTYFSAMSDGLREALKEDIAQIIDDWKEALEANVPEGMLRDIVNTQCNLTALKGLAQVEDALASGVFA